MLKMAEKYRFITRSSEINIFRITKLKFLDEIYIF